MAQSSSHVARLRALLFSDEPQKAQSLATALGVSQPTISRLLKGIEAEILRIGQRRSARYMGRRTIRDVETPTPIYRITPGGETIKFGFLHPVASTSFWFERIEESSQAQIDSGLYNDLPYFLDGLRPSGFIGRFVPQNHPALETPDDIRNWSADDALRYLSNFGHDSVGEFILGDVAFQLYLDSLSHCSVSIKKRSSTREYEKLASDLLRGSRVGSSAAGEQPKFLARREGAEPSEQVLVKFSPHLSHPVGRRVADLLICEHLALRQLEAEGIPAADSRLVEGKERLFLELQRFDRSAEGRRGVIALEALDLEFVGKAGRGGWPSICQSLVELGQLPQEVAPSVHLVSVYGRLIANTDMHGGNLSFLTEGTRVLALTPIYDMLPMFYAPQQGNLIEREFPQIVPEPADGPVWEQACRAAREFWKEVAAHSLISKDFAKIACENEKLVREAQKLGKRLPHTPTHGGTL